LLIAFTDDGTVGPVEAMREESSLEGALVAFIECIYLPVQGRF